ncbi:MAG: hypothetical protein U0174_27915 [Polyangiaceae bacterium]
MTAISNVVTPITSGLAAKPDGGSVPLSLLPKPALTDPKMALYSLLASRRDANAEVAKSDVTAKRNEEQRAMDEADRALERQREAEENKSFWDVLGDIFSVVTIAATAVATLCTGGAMAVASCALTAASVVEQKGHVLEELGVDAEIARWVGVGCSVGAGVTGGIAMSEGATSAVQLIGKVQRFADLTASGALVGRGVTMMGHAAAERAAAMAYADSEAAVAKMRHAERSSERTVTILKETARSFERALGALVEITSEESQTRENVVRAFA